MAASFPYGVWVPTAVTGQGRGLEPEEEEILSEGVQDSPGPGTQTQVPTGRVERSGREAGELRQGPLTADSSSAAPPSDGTREGELEMQIFMW